MGVLLYYRMLIKSMREWRNWQTRTFEGRVVYTVRVQVPSFAPRRRKRYAACDGYLFSQKKPSRTHSAAPPFSNRSRLLRLFACKRVHYAFAALPAFCGACLRAASFLFPAVISERVYLVPIFYYTAVVFIMIFLLRTIFNRRAAVDFDKRGN